MSPRSAVIVIVFASVGVVAAFTTALLVTQQSHIEQEARAWEWGSYPKMCPPLRVAYGADLSASQKRSASRAVQHINKALGRTLYTETAKGPTVTVHGPTAFDLSKHGRCYDGVTLAGHNGWLDRSPTWGPSISSFSATVCFNKIQKANAWQISTGSQAGDDEIRRIVRIGEMGAIAHELLHAFLGDRINYAHPRYTSGLMAARPRSLAVGDVVKAIFKTHIDPHCAKAAP